MANIVYNTYKENALLGGVDLDNDTLKVALVTSSYTPNADDTTFSSEVTGTGYTAGGATLANTTVTKDLANDKAYLDGDDITWPTSTFTTNGAVIYKDSAPDILIAYIDFNGDKSSTAGDFTIQWNSEGIIQLS